ncbi:AI-2E family transporter [Paracoccus stylophorae]|uniref:AI-2E family transporter n=1 Tax=Paracoccus stylophorae TaxID=659350 RepID=A0ABY7SXR1_9RHOB|nr:AI-2E family transporter [Paracoccus stylophorae]WCR10732.1 AI-2E family transporter [Paracoccus stylophorae]
MQPGPPIRHTFSPGPGAAIRTIAATVVLAAVTGWLLVIGKDFLLPIVIAVISVYVLTAASAWLGRQPVIGRLPEIARRSFVLLGFVGVITVFGSVVVSTAQELQTRLPLYIGNLRRMVEETAASFGASLPEDWAARTMAALPPVSLQDLLSLLLSSLGSLAGTIFMVVIYAMFLMSERAGFAHKIDAAFPDDRAALTHDTVRRINRSIGDYLAIKTLINIVLAVMCLAILLVFGVDFALFWAIVIGLLNYIPYVGSYLGVAFPVMLTLAQTGSVGVTLLVTALLILVQTWVGNVLEPRVVGRKVNMSPFVVLVTLTFWTLLWGIPGAILSVPLTSMIAIVLAAFPQTRPIAVLLAEDVSAFEERQA